MVGVSEVAAMEAETDAAVSGQEAPGTGEPSPPAKSGPVAPAPDVSPPVTIQPAASAPRVTIRVTSEPGGAEILLGQEILGETPATLRLAKERFPVEVLALIRVDGEPVGFTPAVIDEVTVGPHDLVVELAGFRLFTKRIDVGAKERLEVLARLVAAEDVAAASRQTESVLDAPASVSTGFEIELRKRFRRGVMFSLGYSFQHSRVGNISDGDRLPNSPVHMAAPKVIVPVIGRDLQAATRLVVEAGRRDREGTEIEPTIVWDLGLSGWLRAVEMRYSLIIRNLLNWRYGHPVGEEVLDLTYRQPGTTVLADLSFRF